jgi:heme-degrading monooxygenase HmoA
VQRTEEDDPVNHVDAEGRMATPEQTQSGPVVLMNRFVVPEGRDDAFVALWTETSEYFRAQPGFVSLKLHRAVSVDAEHRYVNVAVWESAAHYAAPHQTDEFRRLVGQEAWREFPSSPTLYEVVLEHSLAGSVA